jgi:esterase/lipase superfamily enzyme
MGGVGDLTAVVLVFSILMAVPAGVTRLASSDVRDYAAMLNRRLEEGYPPVGFSMGGYGAMNIAMQNPGTFGQVVSISGYFVINDLSDMFGDKPAVMARNDPSAHPV